MQSDKQLVSLQEMLLPISNTQFDAGAFIGNPAIQDKEKDICLKNFIPVCGEDSPISFFAGYFIERWFNALDTISLGKKYPKSAFFQFSGQIQIECQLCLAE
ncbi:MAG: hypothetical protein MUO76_18850 [Anaerolineaceae bacterium]|nr:hypothetical protein [Anaerolineaceae bacterium]